MNKINKTLLGISLALMLANGAYAQSQESTQPQVEKKEERASPSEAMSLVKKAVAEIGKKGKDVAFEEFTSKNSAEFHKKDLYIYVIDMKGVILAHGATTRLVGKSLMDVKDADGKYFVREILDLSGKRVSGWVDYKWPNPVTKIYEEKVTYFEKAGDVIVCGGIYKK